MPKQPGRQPEGIQKSPTGIKGFDEITGGGLPKGRPTLIVGSAGAGKTIFGMEFLIHGAMEYDEPGVLISFEETADELTKNVASMGYDLKDLEKKQKLLIDHIRIERSEIQETGDYDLEGLFVRLGLAIDTISAKRIVLDSIEALFSGLTNEMILRAELRRLFRWLKDRGLTAVITAEQGVNTFTRHGLEEYVSDAVIFLDHRIENQVSTRRIRVVKYRGSPHGTNEYPFFIGRNGFEVLPITSLDLKHPASSERISSGVPRLDDMMGGKGFYRGSTILVSGIAGSGKSSLAASFAFAACQRGERCLYFAYEESEDQIIRNMRSIGLDLKQCQKKGLLRFSVTRPTVYGLEMHLARLHEAVDRFDPQVVIIDPITDIENIGTGLEVKGMLSRVIDFLKMRQVTSLMTSLTSPGGSLERTEVGISSLIDTWLLLRDLETNGERTRGLYILKSRGMAHSNQVREFLLTDQGIRLVDVYLGPNGALTGSARLAEEARQREDEELRQLDYARIKAGHEQKRRQIEAQVAALKAELAAEESAVNQELYSLDRQEEHLLETRKDMARIRQADQTRKQVNDGNKPKTSRRNGKDGHNKDKGKEKSPMGA